MNPEPPSPTPPPPPPKAQSAPPPPAPPPGAAWYYGPFPPPGTPKEGFGASLGKSALRGCVVSIAFGLGLLAIFGVMIGIVAALVAAVADSGGDGEARDFVYGDKSSDNEILSIRIEGVILGEEPEGAGSIFSDPFVVYGYEIKKQLREAAQDGSIKGVVLEFATPGGTIFGSEAIADGIREYRQATGKPVLAFVAGLSASGGMWSMAPADKILADHGSLIGSIGVRLGTIPYYDGVIATDGGLLGGGVTTKNGITYTSITSGRGKDVGSPYRPLTDEEKRVLQQGTDNSYAEFVAHIAKSRNVSEATIRDRMGALIFDNLQAQDFKLIDGTANREEAYAEIAKLAGINSIDWKVTRKGGDGGTLAGLLSSEAGIDAFAAAQRKGICFPSNMVLAYYGDPAALCGR